MSQQNEKLERMLCTINRFIRSLMFQAYIRPTFWVEDLHMASHILNRLPSKSMSKLVPHFKLYNKNHTFDYHRVFGCLC